MLRNRRLLLCVIAVVAALVPAGAARAGGGCHGEATQGTGDTVEMIDACFTPSTLRVDPGTTVTFVNRDGFEHNVSGNGWGRYESMGPGERVSSRFDEEGIYAYACSIHPGMTGSVVVGDGDGNGNGAVVVASDDRPGKAAIASTSTASEGGGWMGAAVGLAIGVVLGLAIASLRRRSGDAVAPTDGRVPSAT